jgi:hypothetical protein
MQCPLCQNDVPSLHKKSHLIPEWTYQNCYNDNYKLVHISIKDEVAAKKQKGLYDEIVCENCESKSQIYDRYASLILSLQLVSSNEYSSIKKSVNKDDQMGYEYWENVDFQKLQKFVFICLMRTELSLRNSGESLLPEKHFNKIRKLYHNNKLADSTSYPIMLLKYLDADGFKDIDFIPFVNKRDGHHQIQFSCAGYEYWVYVSSHRKPEYVSSLCLNSNNTITVLHTSIRDTGPFRNARPTLIKMEGRFHSDNG